MKRKVEFELQTENLGNVKITCFEICPEQIISEIQGKMEVKKDENVPFSEFFDLLKHCCSLSWEEFCKLYPSEKKIVLEKLKEANSDFFLTYPKIQEAIKKLGVMDFAIEILKELKVMETIKGIILQAWSGSWNRESAGLSGQDTLNHGNTAGDSSLVV